MKIERKDIYFVVFILLVFILLDGCEKLKSLTGGETVVKDETVTTTEYITKKQMDSIADYIISNQKSVPQRIVIQNDVVKPVPIDYNLSKDEVDNGSEVITVNKYQDTTKLGNGTIYSEILADKLYGKKFSLATTDTIIKKSVFNKKTVVKSNWFYGAGSTIGLDGRIKDIEGTINYTHKDKFYLEGGLQYDVDPLIDITGYHRLGVKLKVGFNF